MVRSDSSLAVYARFAWSETNNRLAARLPRHPRDPVVAAIGDDQTARRGYQAAWQLEIPCRSVLADQGGDGPVAERERAQLVVGAVREHQALAVEGDALAWP
jgi:hypothetical protein